jgi:hypothetical protein
MKVFKSPFSKGGFRGISEPSFSTCPFLEKGGIILSGFKQLADSTEMV